MKHQIGHFVAICFFAVLSLSTSSAQNVSRQESKKAKLQREIKVLDAQIKELSSQSSSLFLDIAIIQQNIDTRNVLIKDINTQIDNYSAGISAKQIQIDSIQTRIDTLTARYADLVKVAYKNRKKSEWALHVLSSDNLGQAYRRAGYLKSISDDIQREASAIIELKETLEYEKSELVRMKEESEKMKSEAEKENRNLQKDKDKFNAMREKVDRDKQKFDNQLKAKQKEVDALNREIREIIEAHAKSDSGRKISKAESEAEIALSSEFSKNKSKLPWPVSGSIVGKFGRQYHPVFNNLQLPENNGIDIAVPKGTDVKVVFDGVVTEVFVMPGYSQCVLVKHGKNYFTFYCKLEGLQVKVGDKVSTGQVIGRVENVMGHTQLHFELWKDKTPQNPESWLR